MAFSVAFDVAFTLEFGLEKNSGTRLPLRTITDRKYPFDVLTKTTCTTEKSLMTDVQTVRDA